MYPEMKKSFEEVLKRDATNNIAWSNIAFAYLERGSAALAYKMLDDTQHAEQYYKMYLLNRGMNVKEIRELLDQM